MEICCVCLDCSAGVGLECAHVVLCAECLRRLPHPKRCPVCRFESKKSTLTFVHTGSHEIQETDLWNVRPMVTAIDPRMVGFNQKTYRQFRRLGLGNYTVEIPDCYYWLLVNYEEPSTIITTFNQWLKNWLAIHPDLTTIHLPSCFWCHFHDNEPRVSINAVDLFKDKIPEGVHLVFHASSNE